jgi:tyrosinase
MGGGSGRKRFLSWHRAFLLEFEKALQAVDNNAFIPYWDWTAEQQIPPWIAGFTPAVTVPGVGIVTTQRTPGQDFPTLPDKDRITSILKASTYASFTRRLELGPHGEVHEWVGGAMGNIMVSPADPIFWLHHAQLDRLWSMWQAEHPGLGPTGLSQHASIMDPWPLTVAQLESIQTLGYSYGA